jgi:solute:Na+ symporter, SSS family
MSQSVVSLTVILSIVVLGSAVAFYAGSRYKMDLEQWTVAGRGLGLVMVWVLTAGEGYTTFSFLGASGWAYSRGGPVLYVLADITLAYVVSFYILPPIWETGQKYGLQTESDFFRRRYNSKYLAAFVTLVGVIFIIPYLQVQLTGLGIIVEVAGFEGISHTMAMVIASILVASFVLASGVRAVAWVSVLKDILMLFAALFIGIGIPYIYFGGIGHMFVALAHTHSSHLVMPGATKNMGHAWYISTVLLTSFGFYMWPHVFAACFTAKSGDTLRHNAVFMPLYTLVLPFIFFVGFAAILVVPGLRNGDLALLVMVRKTFPPWFLGVIGGAGALTAMVPAASLILTAATLLAKNLFRPTFAPAMTDDSVVKLAKVLAVATTGIALYFAVYSSTTLVGLLLMGYDGVAQFLPGVMLGLYWKRTTMFGVFTGLVLGIATSAFLILGKMDPFMGVNAGFFALCINFLFTVVVSFLTPSEPSGFEHSRGEETPTGVKQS